MEEKSRKIILLSIMALILIIPLVAGLLYVPYRISYDQHMVETVNERALNYTTDNSTITDLTQQEIMENDVDGKYEDRVWKLEHKELYYVDVLILVLIAQICQLFPILLYMMEYW